MAKSNKAMFKLYELRDNFNLTAKTMMGGIENEKLLIKVIEESELKDTEVGKQLVEQTKRDIDQRIEAKPRLDAKLEALNKLIKMYESQDESTASMIDDIVDTTLEIVVGRAPKE